MPQVKRITDQDVREWEDRKKTIPPPFTAAPSNLQPFLDTLDPSKVYITHIDRFPREFKQRIFTVPVVLNLSIAVIIFWRVYTITPWYISLISSTLSRGSASSSSATATTTTTSNDPSSQSTSSLVLLVLCRALTFFLDFLLLRVIAPWPYTFFLEHPANTISWRWRCGFRHEEIVVRESRRWTGKDLVGGSKAGRESPFFKTRVLPAVDRRYCAEKSGYLMMGKDWDLDFFGMVQAHVMVWERKDVSIAAFEKQVLVHKEGGLGWLVWRVHEEEVGRKDKDEELQRRKITALRDRLVGLKKESLFFRWIEIVQTESSKPGVFDRERQLRTMQIVKDEFEKEDVDFDALTKDIGGLEGTPGMDDQ